MPTYICDNLFSSCIDQNANDQKGQDECTKKIGDLCGKQSPPKNPVTADATSTTAGPTSSATSSSEPSGTADSVTSTTADDFAAPTMVPAAAAAAIGLLAYLV